VIFGHVSWIRSWFKLFMICWKRCWLTLYLQSQLLGTLICFFSLNFMPSDTLQCSNRGHKTPKCASEFSVPPKRICCPGQVHVVFVIHLLQHELSAGWVCSGHAVAGGCMFALVHDYSVMRSDKGYMFLSEVCTAVVSFSLLRVRVSQILDFFCEYNFWEFKKLMFVMRQEQTYD